MKFKGKKRRRTITRQSCTVSAQNHTEEEDYYRNWAINKWLHKGLKSRASYALLELLSMQLRSRIGIEGIQTQ